MELGIDELILVRERGHRNHLEHFDSRLDGWGMKPSASFVDMNVGPQGMFGNLGEDSIYRNLDPYTMVFSYQGEDYPLRGLSAEVKTINESTIRWIAHNGPEGPRS
jgi:hypothetical protein